MAKQPAPGEWQYQVENLTAYERSDRKNDIYTRVLVGRKYGDKKRLCASIRNEAGKIVPALERDAIALAIDRQKREASGVIDARTGPLTLAAAFAKMLHPEDGKYAAATERRRSVELFAPTIMEALGKDTLAESIERGHYPKLWRWLARKHVEDGRFGPEAAKKIVGALRTLISWLEEQELVDAGGFPSRGWIKTMRSEWAEITKKPVPEKPAKHRYMDAENDRMWNALPLADPRLEITTEIGGELRQGQVLRSNRSDLVAYNGFRYGACTVHGKGRKAGAFVVFTMAQRHAITRALTSGVLADLEAAYQRGEIENYPLAPQGKLHRVETKRGPRMRASVEQASKGHLDRRTLIKKWCELETLANVQHVPGRAAYGLRRLSSDLAEDVETDDRVLNDVGGWTDSATRRDYQEQGRADIPERAALVREKIRPNVRKSKGIA